MKRSKIYIIVGMIITSVLLAGVVLGLQGIQHRLEWGVEEETSVPYDVCFSVTNPMNTSRKFTSVQDFILMNQTEVIVTINDLPEIPQSLNNETFINEIIDVMKVTITFANGSPILEEPESYLSEVLSSSILPTGDWNLIDQMFQDDDPDIPFMKTWYFSRLSEEHMEFGYTLYGPDYASGWKANVSLDTGIPLVAEYWGIDVIEEYSFRLIVTVQTDDSLVYNKNVASEIFGPECLPYRQEKQM